MKKNGILLNGIFFYNPLTFILDDVAVFPTEMANIHQSIIIARGEFYLKAHDLLYLHVLIKHEIFFYDYYFVRYQLFFNVFYQVQKKINTVIFPTFSNILYFTSDSDCLESCAATIDTNAQTYGKTSVKVLVEYYTQQGTSSTRDLSQ